MRATFAFMGVTVVGVMAKAAQFLDQYSGTLAGAAACVTMAAGLHSMFRRRRKK